MLTYYTFSNKKYPKKKPRSTMLIGASNSIESRTIKSLSFFALLQLIQIKLGSFLYRKTTLLFFE